VLIELGQAMRVNEASGAPKDLLGIPLSTRKLERYPLSICVTLLLRWLQMRIEHSFTGLNQQIIKSF
jgi:hypothetical protein